jgi:hypothetical protein
VKGFSLTGPPRSGETSRLGSMDLVAERDQVRAAWWQEKQDEVMDRSRCKVAAKSLNGARLSRPSGSRR